MSPQLVCPCCGSKRTTEVCAVCFWDAGGANAVSLSEARRNFARFGISQLEYRRRQ